jgi:pSer/pThr/pTyr-binding forkhead associated (FHA) protein
MDEFDPVLTEIDRLIQFSRLKEIEFIMGTDARERRHEIRGALKRLPPGAYLLGTGPSTVGIIALDTDEVVLGRPPTIIEGPSERIADHYAMDTLYFTPREVSRMHAKLVTQMVQSAAHHLLIDLGSTCGTFVNQIRVNPDGEGILLEHGDVISLGPSRTSTYMYFRVTRARVNGDDESTRIS